MQKEASSRNNIKGDDKAVPFILKKSYINGSKAILHCDMNAYYASVTSALRPELKNLPLAVCGSKEERHGIVLAKSQKAKEKGIKTGEIIKDALDKCPDLLILPPVYEMYAAFSEKAACIYESYSPQVESFGLDECWLDISGTYPLFSSPVDVAYELKEKIKAQLGLTISVGLSFNKIFAKLGSDLNKPDAVTVISPESFRETIYKLPAESLLGVGPATKRKLARYGIKTIGALAASPPSFLKNLLGVNGLKLHRAANGRDNEPVALAGCVPPVKSLSKGLTTAEDLENDAQVKELLFHLSAEVSKELKLLKIRAGAVRLALRYNDLFSFTIQSPMNFSSSASFYIWQNAFRLFKMRCDFSKPLRSLSLCVFKLEGVRVPRQEGLSEEYRKLLKWETIDKSAYEMRLKYGKKLIKPAAALRYYDLGSEYLPKMPGGYYKK